MPPRDYESQPVTDGLGLDKVIEGLCSDLQQLRNGEISTQQAMARSALAKQIFNGVRIYLNGTKTLAGNAKTVSKQIEGGGE
jgi:hypothetical protein